MKTVLERDGHQVTIEPYNRYEGEILKTHRIVETNQTFHSEKVAIKKAHIVLMKKALPEKEFNEKMETIRRLKIAYSIEQDDKFLSEIKTFIDRWKGVMVVKNKTNLYNALKDQIKEKCEKGNFGSTKSAIRFKNNKR
jgi:hypothetical protein